MFVYSICGTETWLTSYAAKRQKEKDQGKEKMESEKRMTAGSVGMSCVTWMLDGIVRSVMCVNGKLQDVVGPRPADDNAKGETQMYAYIHTQIQT